MRSSAAVLRVYSRRRLDSSSSNHRHVPRCRPGHVLTAAPKIPGVERRGANRVKRRLVIVCMLGYRRRACTDDCERDFHVRGTTRQRRADLLSSGFLVSTSEMSWKP